jgi:hypothetical protein
MLERIQVIVEIAVHPRRHFESGSNQEPSDTSDTADQDVPGDEADKIAEPELAHQVEDGACEHRAECVGSDGGSDDGVRLVLSDDVGDSAGHVVKEGYDFDLHSVSQRPVTMRVVGMYSLARSQPLP